MTEYDNANRGKVWKNAKKDPSNPDYRDTLPDFTGELDVDGRKFFVDAWKRKPDANPKAPALTFKVKAKSVQPSITERATATIRKPDPISTGRHPNGYSGRDLDDDGEIPF